MTDKVIDYINRWRDLLSYSKSQMITPEYFRLTNYYYTPIINPDDYMYGIERCYSTHIEICDQYSDDCLLVHCMDIIDLYKDFIIDPDSYGGPLDIGKNIRSFIENIDTCKHIFNALNIKSKSYKELNKKLITFINE